MFKTFENNVAHNDSDNKWTLEAMLTSRVTYAVCLRFKQ